MDWPLKCPLDPTGNGREFGGAVAQDRPPRLARGRRGLLLVGCCSAPAVHCRAEVEIEGDPATGFAGPFGAFAQRAFYATFSASGEGSRQKDSGSRQDAVHRPIRGDRLQAPIFDTSRPLSHKNGDCRVMIAGRERCDSGSFPLVGEVTRYEHVAKRREINRQ
jgi:hypothetical protein